MVFAMTLSINYSYNLYIARTLQERYLTNSTIFITYIHHVQDTTSFIPLISVFIKYYILRVYMKKWLY